MLHLFLTVACSLAVGVIFKLAARRGLDRMALLAINYGVAALLAVTLLGGVPEAAMPPLLIGLGLATGALFIGGFFLLSLATETAGMSLALSVMRLSVVIPVVASWVFWHEVPTVAQQVGLLLGCCAFLLMAGPQRVLPGEAPRRKAFLVLALLFLSGGVVDTLLKTFHEGFGTRFDSARFLLFVFATACVLSTAVVGWRWVSGRGWPRGRVVPWGIVLGLVNYGSTAFLLEAVARLPGPVVFPLNNIAIVLGGALLGGLIWREPLSRRARLGLAVAVGALLLLGSRAG